MKNKKFEIITFLLVFLGLFCFLYKFNNEMILTKENIELINQDKNLGLVFEMPNMFDIYVRAISESILKILLFISPLLVVIPTFKKKKITYNYAFILSIIFLFIISIIGVYSKFSLTKPSLYSSEAYFNSNIMFIIITIVNLFLCGLLYINIGQLTKKYFKNYYSHIFSIFLIFFLIEGILQLILMPLIKFETGLSLINVWYNGDSVNNLILTLFLLVINFLFKKLLIK
jgi:hypothetical protein